MRTFVVGLMIGIILLGGIAWAASGADRQIVLREYLGQSWAPALLTYPLEAAQADNCDPLSVQVTGPNGPVAAQLIAVQRWPGTEYVRSARLVFVSDLPPNGEKIFTVKYGEKSAVQPATDLSVKPAAGQVEAGTRYFGLRLLLGDKTYDQPQPAAQVPGPVVGMRRPRGQWFGRSSLYGERKVKSYAARITERGPVLVEWTIRYTYEDDSTLDLTVQLAARDAQALWTTNSSADHPRDGWKLMVTPGMDPLVMTWAPEFGKNKWKPLEMVDGRWDFDPIDVPLDEEPEGMITQLTPWKDWWNGTTQTSWTFNNPAGVPVLHAEIQDPGAWVVPDPPGTLRVWDAWHHKLLPLWKEPGGNLGLRVNNAQGVRQWLLGSGEQALGRELDVVKDYVLDWPEGELGHPHLFLNKQELEDYWASHQPDPAEIKRLTDWGQTIQPQPHSSDGGALAAWLMTGTPEVAEQAKLVERLGQHLNLLGDFDLMRATPLLCDLYDGVMGSGLVSEEDRKLFQARMAYLGYKVANPSTWSIERGYRSYNLNMSVAHVLNLGMIAATLPNHPMAKQWVASAEAMMENFLSKSVGPAGEWPESVSNYAYVSASMLEVFAIAAKNAGFHDYISDPRMRRLMEYLAKQYTPPDPRHTEGGKDGSSGLLSPLGRGGAGGRNGMSGMMARATLKDDPEYSAVQQWTWLRTGASRSVPDARLGGWEYVYMDPDLPARQPDSALDYFPETGAIMHLGVGTPDEWYVYLMAERTFGYVSESGGFPVIFAKGAPISARFAGGYSQREELQISRVLLGRERGTKEERTAQFCHDGERRITEVSALPRQQYLASDFTMRTPMHISHEAGATWDHMKDLPLWPQPLGIGQPPLDWRRQVLFVHEQDPAGVGYLVLRDTVTGEQPSIWQMWTVSEKIGTPEQAADRAAFLADKPGMSPVDAYQLPQSNRYTAVGQFGVDVEYYIAAPTNTPRNTLHFGQSYGYSPIQGYEEYQDLLHLQMPGDGAYFVALYPRKGGEEVPEFATLGGGRIIRVTGAFGKDYCFLNGANAAVEAEGAYFLGSAASVQDRESGLVLSLAAPGQIRYGGWDLTSQCAASLEVTPEGAVVRVPPGDTYGGMRTLKLDIPGQWQLGPDSEGVTLVPPMPGTPWLLQIERGATQARLIRQ